jgi:hypothetical protein
LDPNNDDLIEAEASELIDELRDAAGFEEHRVGLEGWTSMSQKDLKKQAERADNIADQTVDDSMKEILRDAAKDYRSEAKKEEMKEKKP